MYKALSLLGVTLVSTSSAAYLGKNEDGLPIFSIDINDKPADRFREPSAYFREPCLEVLDSYG